MNFYGADAGNKTINNVNLDIVSNFKLVGVNINSKLTWEGHAALVAKK